MSQKRGEQALDIFTMLMKLKLEQAREKGLDGWTDFDNEDIDKQLSLSMMQHIFKPNESTWIDIANYCMMLHQRQTDPNILMKFLGLDPRKINNIDFDPNCGVNTHDGLNSIINDQVKNTVITYPCSELGNYGISISTFADIYTDGAWDRTNSMTIYSTEERIFQDKLIEFFDRIKVDEFSDEQNELMHDEIKHWIDALDDELKSVFVSTVAKTIDKYKNWKYEDEKGEN